MAESPSQSNRPPTPAAPAPTGYAPYGQLVKMLLPSAGGIAIYDPAGELMWCSDDYERPEFRELVDRLRAAGHDPGRGRVEQSSAGVSAFVSALRSDEGLALGSFVLELSHTQPSRYTASMVSSLLRPVLDCLESRLSLEHTVLLGDRDDGYGVDLLLTVDEDDREDASALQHLLRHCVEHLGCVMGALLIPDKNLALTCTLDDALLGSQLLDRTQKHLLAWAQLNNRPMVVNRVGSSAAAAPYKILTCPVRDASSRVNGLMALFRIASSEDFELRDVRILEFVSRKAVSILSSQHDALTGLVNRLIFERRVQTQLAAAGRARHALLYVDVDKLQNINEAFGLQAGDEVIHRVGDVLRGSAGADGMASRVSGDRFAVFLPRRDGAQAGEVAQLILAAAVQLGYVNGAESVPVSVSIGIALTWGSEDDSFGHLLASAELACKRAKEHGRSQVAMHDPSDDLVPLRRQMIAAESLQQALRSNNFALEAQPIVGLASLSGTTIGSEVLVRMRNSSGEVLAPDKFLDAAERYELLPALDRWVLCSVLETLGAQPHALRDRPYYLALNVSAQSLATGNYASFALEQLTRAGLPPAAFCFEIRESVAVARLAQAEQLVREVTKAGCKVALAGFGHGLSSLAHLERLPVQFLKIDGRFVRRILSDRVAESIVSGIAKAARTLGVSAIAEHVEGAALATRLAELEVDFGQGFFLGRPQPFAPAAAREESLPAAVGCDIPT